MDCDCCPRHSCLNLYHSLGQLPGRNGCMVLQSCTRIRHRLWLRSIGGIYIFRASNAFRWLVVDVPGTANHCARSFQTFNETPLWVICYTYDPLVNFNYCLLRRLEARDLSFHYSFVGIASDHYSMCLRCRYPLASSQARLGNHSSHRHVSFLCRFSRHHCHHLDDQPRGLSRPLHRQIATGRRPFLFHNCGSGYIWNHAFTGAAKSRTSQAIT